MAEFSFGGEQGRSIAAQGDEGAGFVDEVEGFVGESAVGEVANGKIDSEAQDVAGDLDFVVFFVAVSCALEDFHGFFDGGFIEEEGVEAAFEGGIFFDVFAVFDGCGCADTAKLSACKGGFEDIGSVEGSLVGFARADDGMEFIEEEDNLGMFAGFAHNHREAFFKVAAIAGACDEARERKLDEAASAQFFRDGIGDDALGESFDEGGFSNASFADDQGVIFEAAQEDLREAHQGIDAASEGRECSLFGKEGEIAAIAVDGGGIATRAEAGLGDLAAQEFIVQFLRIGSHLFKDFKGQAFSALEDGSEEVFLTHEVIIFFSCVAFGGFEGASASLGGEDLGIEGGVTKAEGVADGIADFFGFKIGIFEQSAGDATGAFGEADEEVRGANKILAKIFGFHEGDADGLFEVEVVFERPAFDGEGGFGGVGDGLVAGERGIGACVACGGSGGAGGSASGFKGAEGRRDGSVFIARIGVLEEEDTGVAKEDKARP